MPAVEVKTDTLQRLDDLRVDDESYDELINELINEGTVERAKLIVDFQLSIA